MATPNQSLTNDPLREKVRLQFVERDGEGVLNEFYLDICCETVKLSMAVAGKEIVSQKKNGVVQANGKLTFDEKTAQQWYDTPPTKGFESQIATTINKGLNKLLSSPSEKAKFGFAEVEPWQQSKAGRCYKNVANFVGYYPDYEPLYVYSIWDKGSYYELEPHAIVRHTTTKKVKDITPTVEVLIGKTSLPKICYVQHTMLQRVLMGANAFRMQYGFFVVK
jgi:hypothetical protein